MCIAFSSFIPCFEKSVRTLFAWTVVCRSIRLGALSSDGHSKVQGEPSAPTNIFSVPTDGFAPIAAGGSNLLSSVTQVSAGIRLCFNAPTQDAERQHEKMRVQESPRVMGVPRREFG